jgi:hypothetical protein
LFFGQQAPQESSPAFHSESELVLTTFNVLRGLYFAPDVKPDDVVLLQDGRPRSFSIFEGPRTGRRLPLELVLLFDTTTLPPPGSKIKVHWTRWDREATYEFTNHWGDAESRAVLEKGGADVRVSVYRYDHDQMQRLCRSTKDPEALTNAIRRLAEPIPPDEAIPLTLPPGRETWDAYAVKHLGAFPTGPTDDLYWPVSWTMEAMIDAMKDSISVQGNAIHVLVAFSEGGGHPSGSELPGDPMGWGAAGPTTTSAQDAADQANALGIPVYPVELDFDKYVRDPLLGFSGHTPGDVNLGLIPVVRFGSVGEMTGGQAFRPSRIDAGVVSEILNEVRNMGLSRYVVGFAPPSSGRPHRHDLEIRLKSKSAGKLMGGKRTAVY